MVTLGISYVTVTEHKREVSSLCSLCMCSHNRQIKAANQPAANFGAYSLEIPPPAENKAKSTLAGSKLAFIDARRRPGVKDGILLQIINPKAYAVNSALYSGFAFLPDNLLLETLLKLLIGNAVWFPIHLIWLFAGSALHRLDLAETTQKRINYAMAAAMMTVVLLGVSAAL